MIAEYEKILRDNGFQHLEDDEDNSIWEKEGIEFISYLEENHTKLYHWNYSDNDVSFLSLFKDPFYDYVIDIDHLNKILENGLIKQI